MHYIKKKTHKIQHVKREIRNALRSCICTMYGTVNVSRTSLSVMSEADMKSSDTVTDGSSKELTIEKCASREGKRQEKEKERGDRKKGK